MHKNTHTPTLKMSRSRYKKHSSIISKYMSDYRHQSFFEPHSHAPYYKRSRCETRSITTRALNNEHHPYQVGYSLFCNRVIHTHLSKYCVSSNSNLDN